MTRGVVFRLENMFENDYKSVKTRNKNLCLGLVLILEMKNQITCTRSNQHAFGDVLLAYENGLLLCLEKMLGTNRIKLGLVGEKGGVSCCFCCHDRCNSPGECHRS